MAMTPHATNSESKKLRWGIIGCGQIAYDRVIPALQLANNCQIVGLSDPDSARLEHAAAAVPGATTHSEIEGLLARPEVDAVYIATPNYLHAEQAIAAARAGKHILVEKPMARSAAEASEMVDAARDAGVQLMVAYMTLFNPAFLSAKRLISTGLLGEIVSVRGRHSYPIRPEAISSAAAWRLDPSHGGGPLMDVGVYSIFTLRELTGQRTAELSATGTVKRLQGKTDYDSILFTFLLEDGTPGVIEANFTFTSSNYEIEGTRGRLVLSGHVTQLIRGRLEAELWLPKSREVSERIHHVVEPAGLPEFYNYLAEVEHFTDCVISGEVLAAPGVRAVHDLMVTDAVQQSLKTGARVPLSF